jgi:outer membrane protein assembly factor BamB
MLLRLFAFAIATSLAPAFLLADKNDPANTKKVDAHWSQWRGPSGQGYANDAKIPLTWSEKNNVLWKTKLPGAGNSTPIVWGERIFLTAASDQGAERYVFCVRASDGKILWKKTAATGVAPERTHDWTGYASPSCVTDGKLVWAFFGTPGVFCYDMEGKLQWEKSLGKFTSKAGWGVGASPFLFEDLLIMNCDNDGGDGAAPMALLGLDKKTGKEMWRTPRNQGRGFSTPRLIPVADKRIDLVLNGPLGVWGYDPKTGKERWHCKRTHPEELSRYGEPMPVNDAEHLFILSGRMGPYQVLKLPGKGDVTETHVVQEGIRKGHRDVASPIIWRGLVYCADRDARLSCLDLKTGKELAMKRIGNGRSKSLASPILVQGKILYLLDDGATAVIEPGKDFKVLRRNPLGEGISLDFGASPALAGNCLLLRSQSHLYCIGAKGESSRAE